MFNLFKKKPKYSLPNYFFPNGELSKPHYRGEQVFEQFEMSELAHFYQLAYSTQLHRGQTTYNICLAREYSERENSNLRSLAQESPIQQKKILSHIWNSKNHK